MGNKDKKMVKKEKKDNNNESLQQPAGSAQDNVNKTTNAPILRGKNKKKVITDPRFSSVHSDPRFQNFSKHQAKVTIDSRFSHMFTDKKFSSSASTHIDKRGKAKEPNADNSLRNYYHHEEEKEQKKGKDSKIDDDQESGEETENGTLPKFESPLSDSESESEPELVKPSDEPETDTTSSNSDTDDEDDAFSDDEPEEPEENIHRIEQETHRLAIVNMDWGQVRAVDLYVAMSSFLPKTGKIVSVAVYPSEFGIKRMEEEAVRGPIGVFDSDEEKSDEDDDNNDEIDEVKLRAYEKSRLRYYYAVVECDSSATADYLYRTCDGTQFERSSNVLDLRFIPDSMEFKHPARDIATEAPANYEGPDYNTPVLQHTKINISWDEDEPKRAKTLKRNFNADQLAEIEMTEFLASDDGESDNDEDGGGDIDDNGEAVDDQSEKKLDKREKYRALIQGGDGSDGGGEEDDKDMEVTFNTGLEDLSKRILEKKDKKSETVWEAYLRKKSEKRKARKNRSKDSSEDESSDSDREIPDEIDDFFMDESVKKEGKAGKANRKEKQQQKLDNEQEASKAELELLFADDQDADHKGYKIKPRKAKGKKGKDVPSEDKIPVVDYSDPRFESMFKSPLFALDPTDPQYKRTAAYARQMAQKQKSGNRVESTDQEHVQTEKQGDLQTDDSVPKKDEELQSDMSSKKRKHELSSLVRSIKNKSQLVKAPPIEKESKKAKRVQQPQVISNNKDDEISSMVKSLKKKGRSLPN